MNQCVCMFPVAQLYLAHVARVSLVFWRAPAPAALSSPTQDVAMEMLLHQVHTRNDLILTLKVLVTTIDAQWEGMGDVGSARYEIQSNDYCH